MPSNCTPATTFSFGLVVKFFPIPPSPQDFLAVLWWHFLILPPPQDFLLVFWWENLLVHKILSWSYNYVLKFTMRPQENLVDHKIFSPQEKLVDHKIFSPQENLVVHKIFLRFLPMLVIHEQLRTLVPGWVTTTVRVLFLVCWGCTTRSLTLGNSTDCTCDGPTPVLVQFSSLQHAQCCLWRV